MGDNSQALVATFNNCSTRDSCPPTSFLTSMTILGADVQQSLTRSKQYHPACSVQELDTLLSHRSHKLYRDDLIPPTSVAQS